jgi:hypothetical protein
MTEVCSANESNESNQSACSFSKTSEKHVTRASRYGTASHPSIVSREVCGFSSRLIFGHLNTEVGDVSCRAGKFCYTRSTLDESNQSPHSLARQCDGPRTRR